MYVRLVVIVHGHGREFAAYIYHGLCKQRLDTVIFVKTRDGLLKEFERDALLMFDIVKKIGDKRIMFRVRLATWRRND